MKRCPECGREYDVSMSFCLDDGAELLYGPGAAAPHVTESEFAEEPVTAILSERPASSESQSAHQAKAPAQIDTEMQNLAKRLGVALVAVLVLAGGFFAYRYLSAPDQISSIAVLPFDNRSGNSDTDYLSDGLAESLIYRLSQLPGIKVSPTNSVLRYKGLQSDLAAIANELEVDAVMSGRLTQRGDDLTISVELTDARTKKLIWAEQYARKMSDLLATQREIAATVTQKLQLKLSGDEAKGITKNYTADNEAYQLYLKGRFFWNKRTIPGLKTAIEHFKAAAEKDPNFALAYVGIADSYLVRLYNVRGTDKEDIQTAKAAAERAMEIDPSLAEVQATMGLVSHYLWNWGDAEKYYKRAIELNPNYPTTLHWYSRLLRTLGRYEESHDLIMQAKQADSLSLAISINVGESLFQKGDIAGAIEESRRALDIGSSFVPYRTLAHSYLQLGKKEEALANARKAVEQMEVSPIAGSPIVLKVLGYVHGAIGNRDEALSIARQIENGYAKGEADGRDVAVVYAGLGDNDRVFEWLEKDFQNHSSSMGDLRLEAAFIPFRNDPRFKDLMKRTGLPE